MLSLVENVIMLACCVSGVLVLFSSNPVQSLLSLVLTFALSSIIFMIIGAEFMSLLIFVVYIGAIAVLFLFVIMMLNIKIVELRSLYLRYLSVGFFVILFFFFELFFSIYLEFYMYDYNYLFINWINLLDFKGNIYLFGAVVYSLYSILFILLAIILFIAMFGSIVLLVNWNEQKFSVHGNVYYFNNITTLKSVYIK